MAGGKGLNLKEKSIFLLLVLFNLDKGPIGTLFNC